MTYSFIVFVSLLLTYSVYCQFLELQDIESYRGCRYDADCLPNSFCYGNDNGRAGLCKCVNGYELQRNKTFYECYIPSGLGGNCTEDYHCQEKMGDIAECDEIKHSCGCRKGVAHSFTDGMCYKTAKLTETCLVDQNCLLKDDKFAFCADGRCTCQLKHRPSKDKLSCIFSKDLGEQCSSDDQCELIEHAVCRGVCECAAGAAITKDGRNCLKAATEFGQPCTEDDQCSRYLQDSICLKDTCTCIQGYHGYLTKCVRSVLLQGSCYDKSQCIHNLNMKDIVDCLEGTCQCVYGLGPEGCKSDAFSYSSPATFVIATVLFLLLKF